MCEGGESRGRGGVEEMRKGERGSLNGIMGSVRSPVGKPYLFLQAS